MVTIATSAGGMVQRSAIRLMVVVESQTRDCNAIFEEVGVGKFELCPILTESLQSSDNLLRIAVGDVTTAVSAMPSPVEVGYATIQCR